MYLLYLGPWLIWLDFKLGKSFIVITPFSLTALIGCTLQTIGHKIKPGSWRPSCWMSRKDKRIPGLFWWTEFCLIALSFCFIWRDLQHLVPRDELQPSPGITKWKQRFLKPASKSIRNFTIPSMSVIGMFQVERCSCSGLTRAPKHTTVSYTHGRKKNPNKKHPDLVAEFSFRIGWLILTTIDVVIDMVTFTLRRCLYKRSDV